jgi:hypothetical protein
VLLQVVDDAGMNERGRVRCEICPNPLRWNLQVLATSREQSSNAARVREASARMSDVNATGLLSVAAKGGVARRRRDDDLRGRSTGRQEVEGPRAAMQRCEVLGRTHLSPTSSRLHVLSTRI